LFDCFGGGPFPGIGADTIACPVRAVGAGQLQPWGPRANVGSALISRTRRIISYLLSPVEKAGYTGLAEGVWVSYELFTGRNGKVSAENLRIGGERGGTRRLMRCTRHDRNPAPPPGRGALYHDGAGARDQRNALAAPGCHVIWRIADQLLAARLFWL
jgi:CspA family cold shock protein